jgi:hypothetical protein
MFPKKVLTRITRKKSVPEKVYDSVSHAMVHRRRRSRAERILDSVVDGKRRSRPEKVVGKVSHVVDDGRKKVRPEKVIGTVNEVVDAEALAKARRMGRAASVVAATVGASAVINAVRGGGGASAGSNGR